MNNNDPQQKILAKLYPQEELDRIQEVEDKNERYIEFFKKEKKDWNTNLQSIFDVIYQDNISKNNSKQLINAQAMSLNYRQALNEKVTDYANVLTQVKSEIKKLYQIKFLFNSTNIAFKLNMGEKKLLIEGNLRENLRQSQLLETHIEFLRESIKTLETFSFSVKNVIALMDYLGK